MTKLSAALLITVLGCSTSGRDAEPEVGVAGPDSDPSAVACAPPTGHYRFVVTQLEGDCGDFEGMGRIDAEVPGCTKNTQYRDGGCTIDLDTVCESEERDGSITSRRTRGTVRRVEGSLDYAGTIEFSIRSTTEAPCSGTFELRYERLSSDAGS